MPLHSIILASASAGSSRLAIDLLAILSAAGLVALFARKINLATIPCYLIAGALIGPHALGAAGVGEGGATAISSLATVMLMFTIGLHLDINGLRGGLVSIALVTVISSLLCILVGWPLGILFGLSSPAAIIVGMALSISSTAVVLQILEHKRELHLVQGRTALGVLVLQDMLVPLLMAAVPLLAAWSGGERTGPPQSTARIASEALIAIGGVAALVIVGRLALPRILRAAAFSQEVLLVVSAAVALASAVATAALKFSPELGAFLAGFLLASTPFRYQLAGMLAPLRDLFLAIFFTAIGLDLSLHTLIHGWWIVILAVLATVTFKGLITGVTSWAAGASGAVAVFLAFALAQGGEFSLVLLAQAKTAGILTANQNALAIACIVITLIITPNLMQLARHLMPAARRLPPAWWIRKSMLRDTTAHPQLEPDPAAPADNASQSTGGPALGSLSIIAGFGPVGRAVADTLEKRGVIVTVIELNPRTVEKQHAMGRSIVYGDAGNPEVLHKAGLDRAEAIVLTMPDEEAVLRACRVIRQHKPDIFIAARLNVLSKALQAMQQGADHTVVEELATAEAMAKQVIIKLEQRAAGEDAGPKLYQLQG